MTRITLSSKLLEVDVEATYLPELGDVLHDLMLPTDIQWYMKIVMKPHPEAKAEVVYSIQYASKQRVLKVIEKSHNGKHEHPVDMPEDFVDGIPVPFITEFLEGLPSAMEYL